MRLQVSTACLIDEACTVLRTPDRRRSIGSPSGENSITCIKYEMGRKNGNEKEKERAGEEVTSERDAEVSIPDGE